MATFVTAATATPEPNVRKTAIAQNVTHFRVEFVFISFSVLKIDYYVTSPIGGYCEPRRHPFRRGDIFAYPVTLPE
jgi:hypothetical protein